MEVLGLEPKHNFNSYLHKDAMELLIKMQLEKSQPDEYSMFHKDSNQKDSKQQSQKIHLSGWVTLAIYIFVGSIALLPGLFPSETLLPNPDQQLACEKNVGFVKHKGIDQITRKAELINSWCSIAGAQSKIPAIHVYPALSDKHYGEAAMKSPMFEQSYLAVDSNALLMDQKVLMFTLAHEYQHLNQRDSLYRRIFTAMLWVSMIFSILQLMFFRHDTLINGIAAVFLLPVFTYLICFNSYSEQEIQADSQAYKQLIDMKANPEESAHDFISYMEEFDIDSNSTDLLPSCLFLWEEKTLTVSFTNCNPHPARNQRKINLLGKVK